MIVSMTGFGDATAERDGSHYSVEIRSLNNRFFKQKDTVENYLAWLVKNDRIDLDDAQQGIATDWTQFIDQAKRACPGGKCNDANLPPRR